MVYYFYNFLINNILISLIIIFILFIKNIFKNQLSEKWKYNFYFFILILLFIPFMPKNIFNFESFYYNFSNIINLHLNSSDFNISNNTIKNNIQNTNWLNDFTLSVNYSHSIKLISFLLILWLGIAILLFIFNIFCIYNISNMLKLSNKIKDKKIIYIFNNCKKTINIKKNIVLLESSSVKTPFTFGLFKTFIILPKNILEKITYKDLKYILMHELFHYKNKDIVFNYILSLLQSLYWFNPVIWIVFKKIRYDREIICDLSVLKKINKNDYIEYGKTLINFAYKTSHKYNSNLISSIGGNKKQIKERITKISLYSNETKSIKIKSIFIFIFTGILILFQTSFISANNKYYFKEKYELKNKNTKYENLSSYFKNINGCFVLYNFKNDEYSIYNKENSLLRISPNSTYKIYSALFALESDIIQVDNNYLEWDKTDYTFEKWNKNHNLFSAMQNSVNWYFNKLDNMVGINKLSKYFKQIKYGNCDLSGGILNYWGENSSLKISAVEQVELLKDFYTNKFEFNQNNIEKVKESILISKKDNIALYGKTGTGAVNNKNINGWFIGFVETNDNVYFFALNLKDNNKNNISGIDAAEITLSILKDKNIY